MAHPEYVRPKVHATGGGVCDLRGCRHPCVELMDGIEFIATDYDLHRGASSFQIGTSHNESKLSKLVCKIIHDPLATESLLMQCKIVLRQY